MPAESKRRSAQGDDSARARAGRNRKATVSLPAAATSRRLTWRASMRGAQHSTLPRAPLARACSAAHKASFVRLGETTMSRARSIPDDVQAGACSACGGATSSDHFSWPERRVSAGIMSEHSPMPTRSDRTSVSVPRGQPPPGSSASSAAKPLPTPGWSRWPGRWRATRRVGRERQQEKRGRRKASATPCETTVIIYSKHVCPLRSFRHPGQSHECHCGVWQGVRFAASPGCPLSGRIHSSGQGSGWQIGRMN